MTTLRRFDHCVPWGYVLLSKANHVSGFIVRDGFQGLGPSPTMVPSVFVGQLVHLFTFKPSVHFLFLCVSALCDGRNMRSFHEPFENDDVGDPRLFRKFP